jgi:uncharacterized membrane protein
MALSLFPLVKETPHTSICMGEHVESTQTANADAKRISIHRDALMWSGKAWFVVAACGQLLFAYYIAALYGGSAVRGEFATWSKVMPRGWIEGDTLGNAAIAAHLAFALFVTVAGLMQLIPAIRRHAPQMHRWTGRFYILAGATAALTGIYLIWVRGTVGDVFQHLGTTLNALLILGCAALAWRYARAGEFATHRRWAMRLFVVMSGVWLFRVGLMAWLMIHQKPVGFNPDTFQGPFLSALAFAQTLLPLAILELYFRAQSSPIQWHKTATTALVSGATLITAIGIVGATMMMWWPRV